MGNYQNVIELNGKLYDAITGALVTLKPGSKSKAPTQSSASTVKSGKIMDGFIRKSSPASNTPATVKTPKARTKQAATATRHKPQRAHTLMRHVVKKPSMGSKNHADITQASATSHHSLANQTRLSHAQKIAKNKLVSRFGSPTHHQAVAASVEHLPVQPMPHTKPHAVSQPHHTPRLEPVIALPKRKSEQLIAAALSKADSHQPAVAHHARKRKLAHRLGVSSRFLNIGASAITVVLLGGFIVYQNIPKLTVRIASARAGFHANLPSYQPSGFALKGPVQYSPGQVTISFLSNSDTRNFSISQRVSGWNSEALLDNFLVANHKTYQTYQDAGKTIYIYDGANATWVNGGIWYQVEGSSSLNSDQLIRLADSM